MTGHFLGLQPPRVPKWLLQTLCCPQPANYTKFILGAQEMQFPHRAGVCGEQSSPRAVWLTEKTFHHLRLVVVQHFLVWDLSSFWSLWKWTSETGSHQPHRETLDLRTKARFLRCASFVCSCLLHLPDILGAEQTQETPSQKTNDEQITKCMRWTNEQPQF